MGAQFKSLNFYLLLLLDLVLVVLAHLLAYLTRFEGAVPGEQWQNFIHLLPYFSAIKLGSFFYFDLYRGMWRYTSLPDMFNIVKAVLVSSLLMVGILILGSRFFGFSRSVFLLDGVYTIIFIAALRVGIRLIYGLGWVRMPGFLSSGRVAGTKKKCVLLGAGQAGEKLVREIRGNPDRSMEITAIFDDDPAKTGRLLHGVPIVGAVRSLPYWVSNEGVDIQEILIAMPSLSGQGLRQVMGVCEVTGIPFKTIPSLSEIANGTVSIKALRDVDYRDLLGREQAHLEMERISGYLEGKVVLVTGAGGSIGSELCRQIIPFNPGGWSCSTQANTISTPYRWNWSTNGGSPTSFPCWGICRTISGLGRFSTSIGPRSFFTPRPTSTFPCWRNSPGKRCATMSWPRPTWSGPRWSGAWSVCLWSPRTRRCGPPTSWGPPSASRRESCRPTAAGEPA